MPGMKFASTALAVLSTVGGALAAPQGRRSLNPADTTPKAVYFLRVDPAGANIVSIAVGENGLLENTTTVTSTKGVGLQSYNATFLPEKKVPVGVDPQFGQQSVSVGDNFLFTVNSGSNTAVMFEINPENPLSLQMVGKPVDTLGEYPMSIDYSTKYNKACVLNGGKKNGVACYTVGPNGLVPDGVGLREFGLDFFTPPHVESTAGSASDIQFTGDSSRLIVSLKADLADPSSRGELRVFSVGSDGSVPIEATINQVAPAKESFGFAFTPDEPPVLYVSDIGFGGGILTKFKGNGNSNELELVNYINQTDFILACWVTYSQVTGYFYQIDTGSPNIVEIDPTSGNINQVFTLPSATNGGTDAAVDGHIMYFLSSATNQVAVMNLNSGKLLQLFDYATLPDRPMWTGMAQYPAKKLLHGGVGDKK